MLFSANNNYGCKNRRPDHLAPLWQMIDWTVLEQR